MKTYFRKYVLQGLIKTFGALSTVDLHFQLLMFMKKIFMKSTICKREHYARPKLFLKFIY